MAKYEGETISNRRRFLFFLLIAILSFFIAIFGFLKLKKSNRKGKFIYIENGKLKREAKDYYFVGANIWYGAYLGASVEGRARLIGELDSLSRLGIKNLRVLASSEDSPLENSLKPTFTNKNGEFNESLGVGLDFLLDEMAKRDMTAVLYLTNFWEWSGGMATYQYYIDGKFINMNDAKYPWPAFPDFVAQFYKNPKAIELYHNYVRKIIGRTNSINGLKYIDDPTIMSWQLCNEPRPIGTEEHYDQMAKPYIDFIKSSADLIRSIDKNHLISLGHEGLMGCANRKDCYVDANQYIDYISIHIWPQNWGWIGADTIAEDYENAARKTKEYIEGHAKISKLLQKPLIIEEFGFPRDNLSYHTATSTSFRDKYYKIIFDAVEKSHAEKGQIMGSGFWAWGGKGRAEHKDYKMRAEDKNYTGDPPHEPQGWYSVFDTDQSTIALIKAHSDKIN